jgi:undecaprenyl phosphate-alpha-L-ara4FN deformylase
MEPPSASSSIAARLRVALKIDVNTLRGTAVGVPRLIELLDRAGARGTFLFNMGPDRSGLAVRHLFDKGFVGKLRRTGALGHYGLRSLLYGTLLAAPDIGSRCAATMRAARDAGFETGIHAWDRVRWQSGTATADAEWTLNQMRAAIERYRDIFGADPRVHGAAGWQMNRHSYRLTQRLGFAFCSDTRGFRPYLPVVNAELIACPQVPTTLPTMDELLGIDGIDAGNIAARIARLSFGGTTTIGHVFTLRAELEGMKLLPAFEQLLQIWRGEGAALLSLGEFLEAGADDLLPRHRAETGPIAGRIGTVAIQGAEFLA